MNWQPIETAPKDGTWVNSRAEYFDNGQEPTHWSHIVEP